MVPKRLYGRVVKDHVDGMTFVVLYGSTVVLQAFKQIGVFLLVTW